MIRVLYDRKNPSKPTRKRKKGSFSKSQRREILQILDFLLKNQQHMLSAENSSGVTPLQLAFSMQTNTRLRNHISEIMIQYMSPEDSLVAHCFSGTPLHMAITNNLPHNLIQKLIQLAPDSEKRI
jgi:ankyrin repeat protein